MRFRCAAAVLLVCGSALIAGCPFGLDLGSLLDGVGSGSGYSLIPDGTYAGSVSATVEYWEGGELSDEASDGGTTDAKFRGGALLKDSGYEFQIGDTDFLSDGVYDITREVYDIDFGAWGYEIAFDLSAEWYGTPMTGWEIATYTLNADGSVELFDEIELTSDESYDGGWWTVHSDGYSTMTRGQTVAPGWSSGDILDKKSGKVRR